MTTATSPDKSNRFIENGQDSAVGLPAGEGKSAFRRLQRPGSSSRLPRMLALPKPEVICTHESDLDGFVSGLLLKRLAQKLFTPDASGSLSQP